MKKDTTKLPSIVSLLILTAITCLFWIIFSVFRVFSVKPEYKVPDNILAPISPNINKDVIDQMEQRVYFDENQMPETMIIEPTPVPTILPTATPTTTPTEVEEDLNSTAIPEPTATDEIVVE